MNLNNAHPISDDELVLYHYRDGLDPQRLEGIAQALEASSELRDRYRRLCLLLDHVDAMPVGEPDDALPDRIWQKLEPRINATRVVAPHAALGESAGSPVRDSHSRPSRWRVPTALAAAASLIIAIAIGYYAGRSSTLEPMSSPIAQQRDDVMATRFLDVYVAEHLRNTEGLLLTAVNADDGNGFPGERDVATELVASNRLYAQAAARAGDVRLADFLRQLEPILLELANRSPGSSIQSSDGLRDYLRRSDLLFQVRATQARVSANDPRST